MAELTVYPSAAASEFAGEDGGPWNPISGTLVESVTPGGSGATASVDPDTSGIQITERLVVTFGGLTALPATATLSKIVVGGQFKTFLNPSGTLVVPGAAGADYRTFVGPRLFNPVSGGTIATYGGTGTAERRRNSDLNQTYSSFAYEFSAASDSASDTIRGISFTAVLARARNGGLTFGFGAMNAQGVDDDYMYVKDMYCTVTYTAPVTAGVARQGLRRLYAPINSVTWPTWSAPTGPVSA